MKRVIIDHFAILFILFYPFLLSFNDLMTLMTLFNFFEEKKILSIKTFFLIDRGG